VRPGLNKDAIVLSAVMMTFTGLTLGAAVATLSRPGSLAQSAPWCRPGQEPAFAFGFKDLSERLGETMGQPVECEHGELTTGDTVQTTTTGVAHYHWCTNTPVFARGPEHWALTPAGVLQWTGENSNPPIAQSIVRRLDLRRPCLPGR
jgi:hypothetical protein